MKKFFCFLTCVLSFSSFSESMPESNRKYCENLQNQIILLKNDALKELSGQSNNRQPGAGPAYVSMMKRIDEQEKEYKLKCDTVSVNNPMNRY